MVLAFGWLQFTGTHYTLTHDVCGAQGLERADVWCSGSEGALVCAMWFRSSLAAREFIFVAR